MSTEEISEFKVGLNIWSLSWAAFVAIFVIIEAGALKSGKKNAALSGHVRWTFAFRTAEVSVAVRFRQVCGISLWLWVLGHLVVPEDYVDRLYRRR